MPRPPRQGEAGFTLIEVMVSLALMALITVAGFSLLQGVLGARERTEGRLQRLGEMQRAMFLLTQDFEQIAEGPLTVRDGAVELSRRTSPPGPPRSPVSYRVAEGRLQRIEGAGAEPQTVLDGVSSVTWRFFSAKDGWRDVWPPVGTAADAWPRAVAVELTVDGPTPERGAPLRRVIELPEGAQP